MRTYIFFAMVIVVLVPLGFKLHNRETAAFERELEKVEQGHLIIADNLASTLERYANDITRTFDFIAANPDASWDPAALDSLLSSYNIRFVVVLDRENAVLDEIFTRDLTLPADEVINTLREEAMATETLMTGIIRVNERPLMFLARRAMPDRLVLGAFDTQFLVDQQQEIAFGEKGHAMIVDQNGLVIAHPKPEWTAASQDASRLSVVQQMMAGETGVMQFFSPPLKADMIAGYTSVPSTGWGVMVPQPISELEDAARVEAGELLRLFIILFVAAAAASWLLSGLITRPLEIMSQAVEKVRKGDQDARVPTLHRWSPTELRGLGQLFNGLLDSVAENRAMLEQSLQSARKANDDKSRTISVLSHEMRTPLNGIIGALDMIQRTSLDDTQRRYTSIIGTSSQTLLGHVNDVLEVSRLDSAIIAIKLSQFSLSDLLDDIVSETLPIANRNGDRIILSVGDDLPPLIEADRRKMRNVVANLVGNAAKFTTNGSITVTANMVSTDMVKIEVKDTGTGIAPKDLERVFEPFTVLDAEYGRTQEGTGLGLSIVAQTTEALGGEISVDSTLGRGSTFTVRMPIRAVTVAPSKVDAPLASEPAPMESSGGLKILIVDDNIINRTVLNDMVLSLGHSPTLASDGESALRAASETAFDLILMDISMPGMDGTQVSARIRDTDGPNRDTHIVAQTAHARPEDHDSFAAAGIRGVLIKPVTQDKLAMCIAEETPPAYTQPNTRDLRDVLDN